jgi:Ca2+-binding EF-hand superfamily protein
LRPYQISVAQRAFAQADRNNDRRIATAELADYLQMKPPEMTEQQFRFRQQPQAKSTGASFVLMNRANIAQI